MKIKAILIIVTLLIALGFFGNYKHNAELKEIEIAKQNVEAEKLRRNQEKRSALESELAATKKDILNLTSNLINQGKFEDAQNLLIKFAILQDPEIEALRIEAANLAKIAMQVKKLSDELSNKPDSIRSMQIYQELAKLEPLNPLWPAIIEEIKPTVAAAQAQNERKQAALTRQDSIKALFSPWDGSVYSVEKAIKENLKDPDSYKHVETRFIDSGTGNITVFTQFRARNSFNAIVPGSAAAVVAPTGQIVSIKINNQ